MNGKSKYAQKVEARRRFAKKLGVSVAPYPILWAIEQTQKQEPEESKAHRFNPADIRVISSK